MPLQHFIISSFNKYSMTTWYALSCILTFIIDHFISNLEMQCSPHRKSSSNLSTQILYPCPQQSWIMSRDILNLLYNMSSHSVVSLFRSSYHACLWEPSLQETSSCAFPWINSEFLCPSISLQSNAYCMNRDQQTSSDRSFRSKYSPGPIFNVISLLRVVMIF